MQAVWEGVEVMRFKVGDKVRIKKDLDINRNYGDIGIMREMEEFLGNEARIIHVEHGDDKYYELDIDDSRWMWNDEMLEPIHKTDAEIMQELIEGRNKKPKVSITLGEFLEEQEQERDAIQPPHYNKGEIDLFESWYRTRPFNEFRAIMESIAERYMKRDKEDRVQDLEKSIYTLTRLKEYEELEK